MGIFSNKAIQVHAILTTGVHGITGAFLNNPIGAAGITFDNQGAGGDPILTCNSTGAILSCSGDFQTDYDLRTKSGTAFTGLLAHAISAARTWTFPDVTGNVLVDADTGKSVSFAQLAIENAGMGNDPVFTSNDMSQTLSMAGYFLLTKKFQSMAGTAFIGTFSHAISTNRIWTFPNAAGNVLIGGAHFNVDSIRTAEDFSFKSGTAFNGILLHNITAVKNWTFPDASGTVALACKYINQGDFAISGKLGFGKKQDLLGQMWLEDDGLHILYKGKERVL